MKISELTCGPQMDALVAMIYYFPDGFPDYGMYGVSTVDDRCSVFIDGIGEFDYAPSTTGKAQCFELIDIFFNYKIGRSSDRTYCHVRNKHDDIWFSGYGDTPQEAICKAVIAATWGDTIPNEVMKEVE